ncbi:hypothetical protein F5Y10DRAFT_120334 [Nemania abortiva]|nr:hypothetical protein F5Y10DRAFT_120334 [Nemania abortiva]
MADTTKTPTSFADLPGELRNRVYGLILVRREPIVPWEDHVHKGLTSALLRANKTVYNEARSLLYGSNHFDFNNGFYSHLESFLEQIGTSNAACIRHVLIAFPAPSVPLPGHNTPPEGKLALIQSRCTNLSSLNASLGMAGSQFNDKAAIEAFELFDTRLKATPSLQEITLGIDDEDDLSDHVKQRVESLGWTISVEDDWVDNFGSPDYGGSEQDLQEMYDDLDDYYANGSGDGDDDDDDDDYDTDDSHDNPGDAHDT